MSAALLHSPLFCYTVAMTIQQTIDIPAGLQRIDLPLPKERPLGRDIELHITPARPETEVEEAAHTAYILRELAKSEKKIAEGKAVWHSKEEAFARLDALIEALEAE
jgi:hypothetical protein